MSAQPFKIQVGVCIGKSGHTVGQLTYVKDGAREYSAFAYDNTWLTDSERFEVSSDLPLKDTSSGARQRRMTRVFTLHSPIPSLMLGAAASYRGLM